MNWINIVSNNDAVMDNITIIKNTLIISITLWNGDKKKLKFPDYAAFKEKNSIGMEIGDIIVSEQSRLKEELKADFADGSDDQFESIKSFVFMNAWNERVILEVLAEIGY